ncbi:uncharacterized protein GGS25DRAFT_145115 [Hypoxylon fragiforme]|uniref:uncharacterized protein n=1 Tax=Hypoxylon fragiforme TaxID=63214 RepID=UPI0020C69F75|nr:uncharacterized protein GGS25DRAFT_145115 [Hypoxylon fragiforme]KAI2612990.1 hypothetical protein GGS25DRAFT_145115 [Hypoxylon fragiforme]
MMTVNIRDLSDKQVQQLTKLLSRRPEYGIAIPSRRWLLRQEQKLKSFPSEMLRTSNILKRFFLRIADKLDPSATDPRAILCKTHVVLNPWLIRRVFLAIAYEVTVHTDMLRTWKGRMDVPRLSALVGRIDAIAALWTEPELYRECYGTPPFENHMVFVRSGCEACILSAIGANARVLADLRSIIVDRTERRSRRSDKAPERPARLARFVENWIDHLKEERAAKCRAMSDDILTQLRASRTQLLQWRSRRKKELDGSGNLPMYELRNSNSGHRLSNIPASARRKRRTKDGIPVAMTDQESAEEQRRIAMYSLLEGEKSIYRPDSMNAFSQFGNGRTQAYDAAYELEQQAMEDNYDPYEGEEDEEGLENFERDLEMDERSRSKVTDWYATRLSVSNGKRTADDAKSVMSTIHPAFQPFTGFSHKSAAPSPLKIKKDRPPTAQQQATQKSAWTDATVYTVSPGFNSPHATEAPAMPRIPSAYLNSEKGAGDQRPSSSRPHAPPPNASSRPSNRNRRFSMSSSVYSEQLSPTRPHPTASQFPPRSPSTPLKPPPSRRSRQHNSFAASSIYSTDQRRHRHHQQNTMTPGMFARDQNNPFTRANSTRVPGSSAGRSHGMPVPPLSHGSLSPPLTPGHEMSPQQVMDDYVKLLDSEFVQLVDPLESEAGETTPWPTFAWWQQNKRE